MNDIDLIDMLDSMPVESRGWMAAQRLRRIRRHLDISVKGSELGRTVIVANLVREGGSMKRELTLTGCDEATRKLYNQTCREDMKRRLMADILVDMTVCDMEGWDKMEYLNNLKDEIDKLAKGESYHPTPGCGLRTETGEPTGGPVSRAATYDGDKGR